MAAWNLSVTRQKAGHRAGVVFIHGFQGDPTATWADFPKLLAESPVMDGWDIVSFGYQSNLAPDTAGIWRGDPNIQTIADSLATFARTGTAANYGGLVIVAHSMGGLAVQRALLDHADLTSRVDKVILFGTPSFGLWKAWPFRLPVLQFFNRQVRDMARGGGFIVSLRRDWDDRFGSSPPFGFLAVAGSEDEFVPRAASIDDFPDDRCAVVPGDHLAIVKPTNASDASVAVVLDFIRGNGTPVPWGTAALALERRDFQKAVDQLSPNRSGLDGRALVSLALALDGVGRRSEAMEVLADAKRRGTDAMGVLAGRHKRNWIGSRVAGEADAAVRLYDEAFRIAEAASDAEQAYYHGINLAFLALVYEASRPKAHALARDVLAHCAAAAPGESPGSRMWRLATEAEAHLILGEIDTAVERYKESLAAQPKPWQLASTSQQALRIADELGDETIARRLLGAFEAAA
jgi:pimeloyl-ACP methyl ester carboxylesterase